VELGAVLAQLEQVEGLRRLLDELLGVCLRERLEKVAQLRDFVDKLLALEDFLEVCSVRQRRDWVSRSYRSS